MADCTLNTLSAAASCFDCLSLTEKQALRVHFLAQALKGLGGADLTNLNTRNQAVACFACEPDFRLDSFQTAIAQRMASNAGVSVNLPIATLRAQIKCVPCGEQKSFRASEMYLRCLLNKFVGTGAS